MKLRARGSKEQHTLNCSKLKMTDEEIDTYVEENVTDMEAVQREVADMMKKLKCLNNRKRR